VHDALAAYHEAAGDLEAALAVRELELKAVAGRGTWLGECRCRLKRCRVLARLDRLEDCELAATRAALAHLRSPEKYLADLDEIVRERSS
jgi:hypothetical protein